MYIILHATLESSNSRECLLDLGLPASSKISVLPCSLFSISHVPIDAFPLILLELLLSSSSRVNERDGEDIVGEERWTSSPVGSRTPLI